jgi:hypothetical protein
VIGWRLHGDDALHAYCYTADGQPVRGPMQQGQDCAIDLALFAADYGRMFLGFFLITAGFLSISWLIGWAILRLCRLFRRWEKGRFPKDIRLLVFGALLFAALGTHSLASLLIWIDLDLNAQSEYCKEVVPERMDFHSQGIRCKLDYRYFFLGLALRFGYLSAFFQAPIWFLVLVLSLLLSKPTAKPDSR